MYDSLVLSPVLSLGIIPLNLVGYWVLLRVGIAVGPCEILSLCFLRYEIPGEGVSHSNFPRASSLHSHPPS